jgi:hypothetical protein
LFNTFYSSVKTQLETQLNTTFVGRDEVVVNDDGTSRPSFVILSPGKAEQVITDFHVAKRANKQLSAVFLMGEKAAKAPSLWHLLKGMRVVAQGKKGPGVPYGYVAYHAPPQYHVTFSQAFVNKTLKMIFSVSVGGTLGSALFDTGATHCFVRTSFLNSLGIKAFQTTVNIQLADGQTMRAAEHHGCVSSSRRGALTIANSLYVTHCLMVSTSFWDKIFSKHVVLSWTMELAPVSCAIATLTQP